MLVFCCRKHQLSLLFIFLHTLTSSKTKRFERKIKNTKNTSKDSSEVITSLQDPYRLSISNTKKLHRQSRGCPVLIKGYLRLLGISKILLSLRKKHNIRF